MHTLDATDWFAPRHIGPSPDERDRMLQTVGVSSLDALIDEAIPRSIRITTPLNLPPPESEHQYLRRLTHLSHRNTPFRSYIGLGYHDTITPSVVLRMVMENPGWYTPYTPYQAEIAQGRLESLLNFQTMVSELTGMEVANASLLDEVNCSGRGDDAAAPRLDEEAEGGGAQPVSGQRSLFPADHRGAPVARRTARHRSARRPARSDFRSTAARTARCCSIQTRAACCRILRRSSRLRTTTVSSSPWAQTFWRWRLVTPPGEMGADVVFGTSQRFGVPLGFGGPHAGFFATRQAFVRQVPGRIIGVSVDVHGKTAYRMALATREQHIRREKATSNICTAQALLANMAAMYGVYHGPDGLRAIAARVHLMAQMLEGGLKLMGLEQRNAALLRYAAY